MTGYSAPSPMDTKIKVQLRREAVARELAADIARAYRNGRPVKGDVPRALQVILSRGA